MILVDSSVWIDYFNGTVTPQTEKLDSLLGRELAIGDLILTEVLQGFAKGDFNVARKMLTSLSVVDIGGGKSRFRPPEISGSCANWASLFARQSIR